MWPQANDDGDSFDPEAFNRVLTERIHEAEALREELATTKVPCFDIIHPVYT